MTIRSKIFIYIFSSSVLIIIIIFAVVFYWFSNFHLRKSIDYEKNMIRLVALESKELILTNDLIALKNLCQSTNKSNSHIAYIFVEKDHDVLAHTFTKGVPRGFLNLEEFPDLSDLDVISIENNEGDLFYHFRVKVGTPSFATLHLGFSVRSIKSELIPLQRAMILLGGFLLVIMPFCVAYFLSRIISRPINLLRYGSQRIGKGELDYRLNIKTGDELEQLADEFNLMSERLEVSYNTLEQKVADRTESLQKEIGERKKALDKLKHHEQMLEVSERDLKRFSRKLLSIREEEKKKLSNSLHDELGSITAALLLRLSIVEEEIKDNNVQGALTAADQTRNLFKESVEKLKKITKDLRPLNMDIIGLSNALRQHFSTIEEQVKIKIDFSENIDECKIDDETAIVLYRVNQEAVNNIVKHAGAKNVKIRLLFQSDTIQLSIRDDGKGFDLEGVLQKTDGFGLRGMREWIESAGGTCVIKSAPEKGTEISATIPKNEGE